MTDFRTAFYRDGAAPVGSVFSPDLLQRLQTFCRDQIAPMREETPQRDYTGGPVSPMVPIFLEAIQAGAAKVQALGFNDARFIAGALIPKWPQEGRRNWHVDWWGWENTPDTWREVPPQVGLLCYLDDATEQSGALLVMPNSHRREVTGHMEILATWTAAAGEKMIPAAAGHAVLLDARAMHAVMANRTTHPRTCLTLWFMLDYEQLGAQTRSTVMQSIPPAFETTLGPLCPTFTGTPCGFPHVKKPQFPINAERIAALRHADREVLRAAVCVGDDFLDADTYGWYFGVAAAAAPTRILELGVRYGDAAIAMISGAAWTGQTVEYCGVTAEELRNQPALNILDHVSPRHRVRILNHETTGLLPEIQNVWRAADLIHINGDHSPEGLAAEIAIAREMVKPYGLILIHDIDIAHIRAAADELCSRLCLQPIVLPTQHGLMVLDMRKRTRYGA